jgi:hypothetical protein
MSLGTRKHLEVAMELRLTGKEEDLLRELLQEHHKHLLHEINKTSHREFKTDLRNRCTLVEGMMEKLRAVRAA